MSVCMVCFYADWLLCPVEWCWETDWRLSSLDSSSDSWERVCSALFVLIVTGSSSLICS